MTRSSEPKPRKAKPAKPPATTAKPKTRRTAVASASTAATAKTTPATQGPIVETRAERVIRFIETYCLVPEGKDVGKPVKLAPFQVKFIRDVYDNPHGTKRAILSMSRKNAKALALDTPIPTPGGWTTMGAIKLGDVLFGGNGKPCKVTTVTDVMHGNDCYEVKFFDGASVIADAGHQWTVRWNDTTRVVTTLDMLTGPLPEKQKRNTYPWAVPVAKAVELPDADLPIPPYLLGVWLGDGSSHGARLHLGQRDAAHILAELRKESDWPLRETSMKGSCIDVAMSDGIFNRAKTWCPRHALAVEELLGNKHIPQEYLRGSIAQRTALLRGLMDTDGCVSNAGQATLGFISERLANDAKELVASLGFKVTFTNRGAFLRGKRIGDFFQLQFWPTVRDNVVSVPFKAARLKQGTSSRADWNAIVAITAVPSVPVKCIQVDSIGSTFLFGKQFTVTHNTATIAMLLLAHIIGPERVLNSQVVSGAMSRDQASLVFKLCHKMLTMQPAFNGLYHSTPSTKYIYGLRANVEYHALAADGSTAQGLSPIVAILDEVGQVRGPTSPFIEAITTSQGAYDNALQFVISTQAPSDADCLSLMIDDAIRSNDPHTVVHVYCADKDCDLLDEAQWAMANPALDLFRSRSDLKTQLLRASRIPSLEASARNLLLNQRVAQESLWLAPSIWFKNGKKPNLELFKNKPVHLALDLSRRNDLTAAVFAVLDDDETLHLLPLAFVPERDLEDKANQDRTPYPALVKAGQLVAVPGAVIEYKWVAQYLDKFITDNGINAIVSCQFDRWRSKEFKAACAGTVLASLEWVDVGQGYKDMSPRVEAFEGALLSERVQHGNHPLLNLGAAAAITTKDPAGNRKLDKSKSTQKIDVLVAGVMAAYPLLAAQETLDVGAMVG